MRPDIPSGLIAHDENGCVIANDDTLKCWRTRPSGALNEFMALPDPKGPYDAVYIERAGFSGSLVCARLQAGGYACDTIASGREPAAERRAYVQLAFALDHTCGLAADGALECWTRTGETMPVPTGSYVQLAVIREKMCALRDDGTPSCWTLADGAWPTPPGTRLHQLAAGIPFDCGLDLASRVVCWGVLGDAMLPTGRARQVVAGTDYGCALLDDGHVSASASSTTRYSATTSCLRPMRVFES